MALLLPGLGIGGIACGEGLPEIQVDGAVSASDECSSEAFPYSVDASSSEIQCFIEDSIVSISEGMVAPPMPLDVIMNQQGDPICCEVCAEKDTADQACDAMCNWLACDQARDDHIWMANELGICAFSDCGFDFDSCMVFSALHPQLIILQGVFVDAYLLEADCNASAMDPARPDGLFEYLEDLNGIPNAGGGARRSRGRGRVVSRSGRPIDGRG